MKQKIYKKDVMGPRFIRSSWFRADVTQLQSNTRKRTYKLLTVFGFKQKKAVKIIIKVQMLSKQTSTIHKSFYDFFLLINFRLKLNYIKVFIHKNNFIYSKLLKYTIKYFLDLLSQ